MKVSFVIFASCVRLNVRLELERLEDRHFFIPKMREKGV
jgi:hypothetical protein